MFRASRAALASLLLAVPALAQSPAPDVALESRPAEVLPTEVATPALDAIAADSLTGEQLARRIAHLYVRQAELLEAEAAGNTALYEERLDRLVSDVQLLAQQPGVTEQPRFREVYSSILTEHEQFYDEPALDRGEIYPFLQAANEEIFWAVDGPLLEHVALPEAVGAPYAATIPMEVNALVERSIRFLQRRPGHIERLLSRADTYFPMIERVIAEERRGDEHDVPDEMKYLAMVESALNARAYSHAGAAGMWQFIPATGRAYGLRVANGQDDRLNPERATRAAIRHLRDLHERFGDWHLAMAGYNCNPARIERAVRRAENRLGRKATFWDIYNDIPRETRAYVPMFIATSLVASNPEAYGLPAAYEPGPRYVFDTIPVESGTSLASVARLIGTDVEVIRALNPSLRRNTVPSQREPWMLRIPSGYYAQHAEALDRLAPRSARNTTMYAAQSVNYGTRANRPLSASDPEARIASLRPQPQPVTRAAVAAATAPPQQAAPAPEEPATPVRTASETTTEAAPTAPARPRNSTTHRVRRGETLSGIASQYGTTTRRIMSDNGLRSTRIRSGQRLRINNPRSTGPRTVTHRVTRGQNLTTIARRYGTTVRQIMRENNLRSSTIRPGQRLRIRTSNSRG